MKGVTNNNNVKMISTVLLQLAHLTLWLTFQHGRVGEENKLLCACVVCGRHVLHAASTFGSESRGATLQHVVHRQHFTHKVQLTHDTNT